MGKLSPEFMDASLDAVVQLYKALGGGWQPAP